MNMMLLVKRSEPLRTIITSPGHCQLMTMIAIGS